MPAAGFRWMMAVSSPLRLVRLAARTVGMAWQALFAYRLRSSFVVAAVALGIASLTIIVASIDGANLRARQIVDIFGPDALFVLGGDIRSRAVGQRSLTLSYEDAERIRQALPGATLVVPMRARSGIMARHDDRRFSLTVVGATAGYGAAWNWPLVEGRDLTEEEVERGAKVGLIADSAARELFGDTSPIGGTVLLNQLPVRIVGRLSYRGITGGRDPNERIVIPISTLTQRFNMDRKYFRALRVKFADPENMAFHTENLRSLLRRQHGLHPGDDDDFTILGADEVLKFLAVFKGGLVIFLGITAAVAMIVGGFVLANLFYLSVDERRAEIGIKRALGATRAAILWQILVEALCLCLLGAMLGLLLGLGCGRLMARLELLQILFSWRVFFWAGLASSLIGLLFGLKPARQAAAMTPIAVLKGE